jgi:hypothetical protein
VTYRVYRGRPSSKYIVARSETDGFLYDDHIGRAAARFIKPGSAVSLMGGEVEWRPLHRGEDVPPLLVAIMKQRGMTFAHGRLRD